MSSTLLVMTRKPWPVSYASRVVDAARLHGTGLIDFMNTVGGKGGCG
jgi:hypothetical protein